MKYQEYGNNQKDVIILLHGGGLSWWNYRDEAELLQEDYHVVLPILDGHAGSDRPFTSIADNAAEIIDWIDEHCGGSVLVIGGLSLGAQVALEILATRKDICRYALLESAAVIPLKLTNALVGPAFGSSYGLIKNRHFAKLQAKSLHIRDDLFEDYYRDTCLISKPDIIAFMKANTSYVFNQWVSQTTAAVHLYFGEKETVEIRKSAEQIHQRVVGSTLTCLPDYYHGEFSLNHPKEYVDAVNQIVRADRVNML